MKCTFYSSEEEEVPNDYIRTRLRLLIDCVVALLLYSRFDAADKGTDFDEAVEKIKGDDK